MTHTVCILTLIALGCTQQKVNESTRVASTDCTLAIENTPDIIIGKNKSFASAAYSNLKIILEGLAIPKKIRYDRMFFIQTMYPCNKK